MKRTNTTKELIEAYTPTEEECRFVATMTRTAQHQLNLLLWIKLYPCLGYFPAVDEIPSAIVAHIRNALSLPGELIPAYENPRTLYRHHQLGREYYQIVPYGKDARQIAVRTICIHDSLCLFFLCVDWRCNNPEDRVARRFRLKSLEG